MIRPPNKDINKNMLILGLSFIMDFYLDSIFFQLHIHCRHNHILWQALHPSRHANRLLSVAIGHLHSF